MYCLSPRLLQLIVADAYTIAAVGVNSRQPDSTVPSCYSVRIGRARRAVASRLFVLLPAPRSLLPAAHVRSPSRRSEFRALKTLRGQGKLTESNMRDGLKLVEKSLLEADVSFPVVRDFMSHVTEQAVGEKVLKSLNPSQQVVGIVYQELVNLMGPVDHSLHLKGADDVTVLMMCGLQGSGKTTTAASWRGC